MTATFKLISANLGTSLLSVSDTLNSDKPELLFLQEVINPTSELLTRVSSFGYSVEPNFDPLNQQDLVQLLFGSRQLKSLT